MREKNSWITSSVFPFLKSFSFFFFFSTLLFLSFFPNPLLSQSSDQNQTTSQAQNPSSNESSPQNQAQTQSQSIASNGLPSLAQNFSSPDLKLKGLVMVIPIHGDIDGGISFFLQRMLRKAEKDHAVFVILEINSNGGLLTSAQEMKDALLACRIPTLAYVKGRAFSAAALIAISCQKIMMEPGSEMGAATPIELMGTGVKAAEEKFVSALSAEFESTAETRRRPKALAGAMVDKNHDTISGLVKRGEILTLTSESALNHGYCDQIVSSLEYALHYLNIEPDPLERVEPTSGELIARYLTNPSISPLLFTLGLWAIVLELSVFGWGVFGWLGIVCVLLFFGGHLFAYLAGFEAVLLFFIGIFLLLLEILVIPGFGLTGILGILATLASVVMIFGGLYKAAFALAEIISFSFAMILALFWLAPRMKLFDRFVLKGDLTTEAGFIAVDMNQFDHLLNLEGITVSPLRPSGKAKFGSEKFDVMSDGDFVEKDTPVTVIKVEGQKIVVKAIKI
ncbi:MAG: nodulation protein NfeD [Candidatus Riflebacteria bacterium]|nr:nodulation protein NfeD [Candidatus Riflebacteria bacterium]